MPVRPPRALLVVEDDADLREAVTSLLMQRGFDVQCARNGRDALRQLKASAVKPAAILLDLAMPIMDGFAFREEQILDPVLSTIPVVVMSAERDLLETAAGLMPVAVLEKPVPTDQLVDVVETLLDRSGED
jgi:DNA-binding response OmpR family regulator